MRLIKLLSIAVWLLIGVIWGRIGALWLINRTHHHYTCAEMIGTPPRPNYIAVVPPGYSVGVDMLSGYVDTIEDEHGRIVCGPYRTQP